MEATSGHAQNLLVFTFKAGPRYSNNWVLFVHKFDRDIEVFGTPRKLWLCPGKWFNHKPWPDSPTLIMNSTKFWIERFEEEDNLEIRIVRFGRWIIDIWVGKKEKDWMLYCIGVHDEKYQHIGLGKFLLVQVIACAKAHGVQSIYEKIEKDCKWPKRKEEFSALLEWYKRQGFILIEDETNFILTLSVKEYADEWKSTDN